MLTILLQPHEQLSVLGYANKTESNYPVHKTISLQANVEKK